MENKHFKEDVFCWLKNFPCQACKQAVEQLKKEDLNKGAVIEHGRKVKLMCHRCGHQMIFKEHDRWVDKALNMGCKTCGVDGSVNWIIVKVTEKRRKYGEENQKLFNELMSDG